MSSRNIVVLGSCNMDLVLPVERLPRPGETLLAGNLAFFPGGKGANQAVAAARLGGRVSMIAETGADAFGPMLIASLEAAGVDTSRIGRRAPSSGCALIAVLPDGENAILVSPGANAALEPEMALSRMDHVGRGTLLLAQLETPLETVHFALAAARSRGAVTMLDPAPARRLPAELLREVDYLTPNQTEAATVLGTAELGDASVAAEALLAMGPRAVILKLGPSGCYVATPQERGPVSGFSVEAVDTTAAGDTFNAAFAVALSEGLAPLEAARFANAAAALSVTRRGAQTSVPSRQEVEEFLHVRG